MICLVSSCGGHLTELRALRSAYEMYPHFYVLNDKVPVPADMEGNTQFIVHAERDWKVLWNCVEAWRILRRQNVKLILSTGAGPLIPFALVGKLLGIPTIFVETMARVHQPSLTGRLMHYLTPHIFYQWPQLKPYFPHGTYGGLVL